MFYSPYTFQSDIFRCNAFPSSSQVITANPGGRFPHLGIVIEHLRQKEKKKKYYVTRIHKTINKIFF